MKDIFTGQEIVRFKPEHVVPDGLGGRLVSLDLIDASTNGLLGGTIERHLMEALAPVRVALGQTSRRGKEIVVPTADPELALTSGWMPRLTKRAEGIDDEGDSVSIRAATPEKAHQLLAAAQRRFPHLKTDTATAHSIRQYVEAKFRLSLGGPLQLRAVAKMCFELAAIRLPRDLLCSSAFDQIRQWIWSGVLRCAKLEAKLEREAVSLVNWDFRPALWHNLASLPGAPLQHRVFVFGGPELSGAVGVVELFGNFRFSCRLSDDANMPAFAYGYLIDPDSGEQLHADDRKGDFQQRPTLPADQVPLAAMNLDGCRIATEAVIEELTERHRSAAFSNLAREAMAACFPCEGEIIQPEHLQMLATFIAERFTEMVARVDTWQSITLQEWLDINPRTDDTNSK